MTNDDALAQQLAKLSLQQRQLQWQLQQNAQQMQSILRRVWQINDKAQKRIANDLHDGVGQLLTALVNELSVAPVSAGQQRALDLAKLALQDTRQISRLLRPPVLDDLGLPAALSWLVRQISASCPELQIQLQLDQTIQLAEELQVMVFRVCQEALTNIVKYAKATSASIELRMQQDNLTLTIVDNGIGFELNAQSQQGVGLCSMQDRAYSFGGRCLIESVVNQGCKIILSVPMQEVR